MNHLAIGLPDRIMLIAGAIGFFTLIIAQRDGHRRYGAGWWKRWWNENNVPGGVQVVLTFVSQKAYPNRIILSADKDHVTFVNVGNPTYGDDDLICDADWDSEGDYVAIYRPDCTPVEAHPHKGS